jgi:NADPH-dependent glutamate synthase beta subunit-like oxidoreductase
MMNLIPESRLDRTVVQSDIQFLLSLGAITAKTGTNVEDPQSLLAQGYDAVCLTTGLWKPIELGIENEHLAIKMVDLLSDPQAYHFDGRVAIVGGGATAVDCAITARGRGATHVELFMLEKLSEMPLTAAERQELIDYDIEVNGRIRLTKICTDGETISAIKTKKVRLSEGQLFKPANVRDVEGTEGIRTDFHAVITAIGMRSAVARQDVDGLFYAGDISNGPSTVVEAVASGKNTAIEIDAYLQQKDQPEIRKATKSCFAMPGYNPVPVSLEADFFGRSIQSPYLLSASPLTDGFEQMNKADSVR